MQNGICTHLVPPPSAPPACRGGPTGSCTRVVDTDERDCVIDEVCVDTAADAASVSVTVPGCGTVATAPLERTARPAALGGGEWFCTGRITIASAPGSRRTSGGAVTVGVTDAAGNRGGPTAITPPCFVPERFVSRQGTGGRIAHVRDAAGRPVVIVPEGGQLVVRRFDGSAWQRIVASDHAGSVYRGRPDIALLDDGSIVVCATRRPSLERDVGSDVLDAYDVRGALDLLTISSSGSVQTTTIPRTVLAQGCGLDARGSSIAVAVAAPVAVASLPPGRRGAPGVPGLLRCEHMGAGGLSCPTIVRTFADVGGTRALSIDPDVSLDPAGVAHLVGRGLQQPTTPRGTVEEFSTYLIDVPPTGGAVTLRVVTQQISAGWYLAAFHEGSGSPRVFSPTADRRIVFATHYAGMTAGTLAPDRCTGGIATTIRGTVFTSTGRVDSTVAPINEGVRPPRGMWRHHDGERAGISAPNPPLRRPTYADPEPEALPGFDVVRGALDLRYHVAYDRRWVGEDRCFAQPGGPVTDRTPPETRGSVWYDEIRLNTGLRFVRSRRHRVDVETGFAEGSARTVALAVDRPGSLVSEPSVAYDRHHPGGGADVLYADARAGQFVDSPRGRDTVAAVPSGTCWAVTDTRVELDVAEANLVPAPPWGSWTASRADAIASQQSTFNRHREMTGALSCALNAIVGGTNDATFNAEVREPVVGRALGILNSVGPERAALVMSGRVARDDAFEGSLVIQLDDGTTVEATAPLTTGRSLAQALDASLAPNGRVRVSQYVVPDGTPDPAFARITVSVAHARFSAAIATVTVRDTQLARALGFPIDERSFETRVDPMNGDLADVHRPDRSREPCAAVNGDRTLCERPSDAMPAGISLFDAAFAGTSLRLGRPLLREVQEGVCLPIAASGAALRDPVCEAPLADGGTHLGFPGTRESAGSMLDCAPGSSIVLDACVRCAPAPAAGELPDAIVRTCSSHSDCDVGHDCLSPTGCDPSTSDFYCTQRGVEFLGLPPGTGFCARPRADCAPADSIPLQPPQERPTPHAPLMVCRSVFPSAGNAGNDDFEPHLPECATVSCLVCNGARDRIGTYCTADEQCPSAQQCVVPGDDPLAPGEFHGPACVMRPFFADPRWDAIRGEFDDDVDESTRRLEPLIVPQIDEISDAYRDALRGLGTSLPQRVTGQVGEINYVVTDFHADIAGIDVRVAPDDDSVGAFPGAGDLSIDILFSGLPRATARLEGQIEVLGVRHGIRTNLIAEAQLAALRAIVRPRVIYSDAGEPRLAFRVVRVDAMHRVSPDGQGEEVLEASDINIVSSSQQGSFIDFLRFAILGPMENIIVDWLLENNLVFDDDFGDLGTAGLDAESITGVIASLYQLVAEQPLIGGGLFGEETLALFLLNPPTGFAAGFQPARLEGAALEVGPDAGSSAPLGAARVPGLALHYRGGRIPIGGVLADTAAVCIAVGEPNPNCLEGASDCPP